MPSYTTCTYCTIGLIFYKIQQKIHPTNQNGTRNGKKNNSTQKFPNGPYFCSE
jgi:hypothetical protein